MIQMLGALALRPCSHANADKSLQDQKGMHEGACGAGNSIWNLKSATII